MDPIDWTLFDKFKEPECECECGAVFRSYAKHVRVDNVFVGVTQKPCPSCGKTHDHLRRVSYDPEIMR